MESSTIPCPIWGHGFTAKGYPIPSHALMVVEDSPRAGGGFEIGQIAQNTLRELNDSQRAMLTTMLIDLRSFGVDRPKITPEMVEDAKHRSPLPIPERALRLLRYFVKSSENIGQQFILGNRDPVEWGTLAWSESEAWYQAVYFAEYLEEKNWIALTEHGDKSTIFVLVDGYSEIAEQVTNVDSTQAFVAMWFSDETRDLYKQGIQPAVEDAGYVAVRIDEKPDLNKTDDEIIAEIRRSRFVVADFTHGEDGARGSVYFEAGFADGSSIPVIHTCRCDQVQELHFDTRQYHHILWNVKDFDGFRKRLRARIVARMGPGPKIGANV